MFLHRPRIARRAIWLLAPALVASLGLLAGAGLRLASGGDEPVVAASAQDALPSDAGVQLLAHFDDGSHVFAMLWRGTDELWYVRSRPDGTLTLARHSVDAGTDAEWDLSAPASQTPYSYLVADSNGLLWVGANYTLAAFDPAAGKFVFTTRLSQRPPELSPEAAIAQPFEGSWIRGMLAAPDGTIEMVRENSLAVYSVSTDGIAVAATTNVAPSALRVVDGVVQPVTQDGDEFVVIATGARVPARQSDTADCSLNQGPPGKGASLIANGATVATGLLVGPLDPVASGPSHFAAASGHDGLVAIADCARGTGSVYGLGSLLVYPDGLPSANDGEPIRSFRTAESLAVNGDGVAAAGLSTNELVLIGRK